MVHSDWLLSEVMMGVEEFKDRVRDDWAGCGCVVTPPAGPKLVAFVQCSIKHTVTKS